MKKEVKWEDFNIIFDNPFRKLDDKRQFLINSIQLYANKADKEIQVVIFEGKDEEKGVRFFYKKNE